MSTTILFICLLNYFLFEKTKAKFFTSICKKWTIFYSVYVGNLLVTVFAIKSSFSISISLFDVNNNDYNNTGVILKNNMENATTADSVI